MDILAKIITNCRKIDPEQQKATSTGCGKKVIPCRILQIFKQPL